MQVKLTLDEIRTKFNIPKNARVEISKIGRRPGTKFPNGYKKKSKSRLSDF